MELTGWRTADPSGRALAQLIMHKESPRKFQGLGFCFSLEDREKNSLKMSGMSLRAIQVNGKRLHSRLSFSQLLNWGWPCLSLFLCSVQLLTNHNVGGKQVNSSTVFSCNRSRNIQSRIAILSQDYGSRRKGISGQMLAKYLYFLVFNSLNLSVLLISCSFVTIFYSFKFVSTFLDSTL